MAGSGKTVLRVAVLGAGGRGNGFGDLIQSMPELGKVVAVAEPRPAYRDNFAKKHGLGAGQVFNTWQEFVAASPACDAVVIATMDQEHVGPAIACLNKGMHLFLEKPMAVTLEDCRAIEAAQRKSGAMVAVCHSLRYHSGFSRVKELLSSGAIGTLISLDQLEQVAYWHYAHSYIRGNWRRQDQATFMLMAKSCHDIDYIAHLVGKPCVRVASSGSLSTFKKENAPPGSTPRCTDGCAIEATCAYSALRIYVNPEDLTHWPPATVSPIHTRESHLEAVKTGPYGRCVWHCDNDVVDHQVVMLEFETGITATFTMMAYTQDMGRRLRLHGTDGELYYEETAGTITVKNFSKHSVEEIKLPEESGGHGGGDTRTMRAWLQAVQDKDPKLILTNAQASLASHEIVFAAERARLERRGVEMKELAVK